MYAMRCQLFNTICCCCGGDGGLTRSRGRSYLVRASGVKLKNRAKYGRIYAANDCATPTWGSIYWTRPSPRMHASRGVHEKTKTEKKSPVKKEKEERTARRPVEARPVIRYRGAINDTFTGAIRRLLKKNICFLFSTELVLPCVCRRFFLRDAA